MDAAAPSNLQKLVRAVGLEPIARLAALTYYRWAMSQIDPLHPDVPSIVCRINELEQIC